MLRPALWLALGLATWTTVASAADPQPDGGGGPVTAIDGLVAWYHTGSLHRRLHGEQAISTWPDASGNGHDLVDDQNGGPAMFEVVQINGLPAVRVGKSDTYSVTAPFDLEDHTIFLVYASSRPRRALLRHELDEWSSHGIVLRQELRRDLLHQGQTTAAYGTDFELGDAFAISVLGREAGTLRAFINGADISSQEQLGGTVRIGRFFGIRITRYVTSDGSGLRIAEMIFYDRFLDDDERNALTSHLSEKYAIPLRYEARALLSSTSTENMNVPGEVRAVAWDEQRELRDPLRQDPEKEPTRVFSSQDGTRVRLSVRLELTSEAAGPEVRVFVLKNYEEYLPVEARSGPLAGDGAPKTVELDVTLTLDDGEYFEIVTSGGGTEGKVTLVPGASVLRAEVLP